MSTSRVAVLRTTPRRIFGDYHCQLNPAEYQSVIDKHVEITVNPLSIKCIRPAHELGLSCGNPRKIDLVGDCDHQQSSVLRGII